MNDQQKRDERRHEQGDVEDPILEVLEHRGSTTTAEITAAVKKRLAPCPSFTLNGVQCDVAQVEGHACFEAVTPDFGLSVIYPGWYTGEHGAPAQIVIVGDIQDCLQWLPIDPADKRALIDRLPLDEINKTMFTLAV